MTPIDPDKLNLATLAAHFSNEDAARELMEQFRWPEGSHCPHCGSNAVTRLTPKPTSRRRGRKGLVKCRACRKQLPSRSERSSRTATFRSRSGSSRSMRFQKGLLGTRTTPDARRHLQVGVVHSAPHSLCDDATAFERPTGRDRRSGRNLRRPQAAQGDRTA